MLGLIPIVTGVLAGTLMLVQAKKQPEKAKQLRTLSLLPFGMAVLMVILTFV